MELKNRRRLLKISQIELAKNVKVTNDYISCIERKNKLPSFSLMKKISLYLTEKALEQNIPPEIFTIENIFFNSYGTKCSKNTK